MNKSQSIKPRSNSNISAWDPKAASLPELQGTLQAIIEVLEKKYIGSAATSFPKADELNALTDALVAMGHRLGRKKIQCGQLYAVIKTIDGKYKKLGLLYFVDKLIKLITELPVPPKTAIWNRIAQLFRESDKIWPEMPGGRLQIRWKGDGSLSNPAAKTELDQLTTAYNLLGIESDQFNAESVNWAAFYPLLATHTSKLFIKLLAEAKPPVSNGDDLTTRGNHFTAVLGYAAFTDLYAQQTSWMKRYHKSTEPLIMWISSLQSPEYDTALRIVLHGSLQTPAVIATDLRKLNARERKRLQRMREKAKNLLRKP